MLGINLKCLKRKDSRDEKYFFLSAGDLVTSEANMCKTLSILEAVACQATLARCRLFASFLRISLNSVLWKEIEINK